MRRLICGCAGFDQNSASSPRLLRVIAQRPHFSRSELPPLTFREVTEHEWPDGYAYEAHHFDLQGIEQTADVSVFAFFERDLEP